MREYKYSVVCVQVLYLFLSARHRAFHQNKRQAKSLRGASISRSPRERSDKRQRGDTSSLTSTRWPQSSLRRWSTHTFEDDAEREGNKRDNDGKEGGCGLGGAKHSFGLLVKKHCTV